MADGRLRWLLAALVAGACGAPVRPVAPPRAPTVVRPPAVRAATRGGSGWLRPCAYGSADAKAGLAALEVLAGEIDALAVDADARPLAAKIRWLVDEGECFQFLKYEERDLDFEIGASLKEWWAYGGAHWMSHALRFDAPDDVRRMWIPPTARRTLSRESAPRHRLASTILCSLRDRDCGAETRAWQRRAATFFELFDGQSGFRGGSSGTCEETANARPERERYQAWHACVTAGDATTVLPLGGFRSPREGWLVVRGIRGHYAYCDEVRAYDLATGAAYIVRDCGGMHVEEREAIAADRYDGGLVGRVPVDALREAAWMILLADEVQHRVRIGGSSQVVPEGIDIVLPAVKPADFTDSVTTSSGQTTLAWSWSLGGVTVDAGELTWPRDYNDAAREHAVRLLEIAELGFVAGCAPARLPATRTLVRRPPGSGGDGVPRQVGLMLALGRLRTARLCR